MVRESLYISSGVTLNIPRSRDRRADAAQMGSERKKATRTRLTSLANKSSVTVTQPGSKEGYNEVIKDKDKDGILAAKECQATSENY